jgi:alkylated DNA nucleotide flippase Atl1
MSFRSLKPGGKCSQTSRRPDSELAKSVSGQLDQSDEALPWHRSISSAQYAQGNIMKRYEKICTVAKMIEKEFSDFQRNVEPC